MAADWLAEVRARVARGEPIYGEPRVRLLRCAEALERLVACGQEGMLGTPAAEPLWREAHAARGGGA